MLPSPSLINKLSMYMCVVGFWKMRAFHSEQSQSSHHNATWHMATYGTFVGGIFSGGCVFTEFGRETHRINVNNTIFSATLLLLCTISFVYNVYALNNVSDFVCVCICEITCLCSFLVLMGWDSAMKNCNENPQKSPEPNRPNRRSNF